MYFKGLQELSYVTYNLYVLEILPTKLAIMAFRGLQAHVSQKPEAIFGVDHFLKIWGLTAKNQ